MIGLSRSGLIEVFYGMVRLRRDLPDQREIQLNIGENIEPYVLLQYPERFTFLGISPDGTTHITLATKERRGIALSLGPEGNPNISLYGTEDQVLFSAP